MKRGFVSVGGALILGVLALLVVGSVRYGGPDGLLLRVRAEIAAQRPRPVYVPTPLPTSTRPSAGAAAPTVQRTRTPLPTATVTPAVTERATASSRSTVAVASMPSPTAMSSPTPTRLPALAPPGPTAELTGLTHVWQTWNNCGPATLSMYLSFWGRAVDQEGIRRVVRPNPEDKHAGAEELADIARSQGLNALVRVDGSAETLRQLVANGVPVMATTWHEDAPGDGMGHYRLIVGYDDGAREWLLYDSLAATAADRNAPYEPLRMSYDAFEPWWIVFNRRYVIIYPDELAGAVRAILAEDVEDRIMWEGALAHARAELAEDAENPFHWFNLGSDLVALDQHEEAASAYDRARQLGLPWRMLWYQFGPFPAYYHVGRYDEVIALADATLKVTTHIEELHYWRGRALAAQGDIPAARAALERALELKPGYPEALEALEAVD